MLSVKTWQTFPSLRQVSASLSCGSSPAPGPAGPISDGNGCGSRILSAHSRLTSNQLGLMNDWNATGSAAMTKMHSFLRPPLPHLTVLFAPLFLHFHQLLKNSTHHIGSAADAEAKNEARVAGHRCSTWDFVQLARSFLSGHHLTLLWFYHWVDSWGRNMCLASRSQLLFLMSWQAGVYCTLTLNMLDLIADLSFSALS